jgi:hypothetical protein
MNPQCRNNPSGIFFSRQCVGVHKLAHAKPENIQQKQAGKKKAL